MPGQHPPLTPSTTARTLDAHREAARRDLPVFVRAAMNALGTILGDARYCGVELPASVETCARDLHAWLDRQEGTRPEHTSSAPLAQRQDGDAREYLDWIDDWHDADPAVIDAVAARLAGDPARLARVTATLITLAARHESDLQDDPCGRLRRHAMGTLAG